jgi:soluble lytic murein transglycosylase-like protein
VSTFALSRLADDSAWWSAALGVIAVFASLANSQDSATSEVERGGTHQVAAQPGAGISSPFADGGNVWTVGSAPAVDTGQGALAASGAAPAPHISSGSGAAGVTGAPGAAAYRAQLPYQGIILDAARRNGLPPEFLAAALHRESAGFKEKYVRGWHEDQSGRGIAGIDKTYHPEVSDDEAFDPQFAINWMAVELGRLNRKHGNTYDASREYNGGPNFASERIGYGGRTVNELTERHANAIAEMAARYRPVFLR